LTMTLHKYKCQQCGLVVETTHEQAQITDALMCPDCDLAGIESALLPTCRMECSNGAPCGCAVPGFACS
jgi:DNA-directed RNA polymerase subunit RPC12/RpoP